MRWAVKPIYDYHGIQWKQVTPTDIDGSFDFRGHMIIMLEGKTKNGNFNPSFGQAKHYDYLGKLINKGGADFLFIVFEHDKDSEINPNGHIMANRCNIVKVKWDGEEQDLNILKNLLNMQNKTFNIKNISEYFGRVSAIRFPEILNLLD